MTENDSKTPSADLGIKLSNLVFTLEEAFGLCNGREMAKVRRKINEAYKLAGCVCDSFPTNYERSAAGQEKAARALFDILDRLPFETVRNAFAVRLAMEVGDEDVHNEARELVARGLCINSVRTFIDLREGGHVVLATPEKAAKAA